MAKVLEFDNRADWLEARSQFLLGASEWATAFGMNPWKTRRQLVLEKMGEVEPAAENLAMYMGNAAEPVIRELHQHPEFGSGRKLQGLGHVLHVREEPFEGESYDWLAASLDDIQDPVEPYTTPGAWEGKNVGFRRDVVLGEFQDNIPDYVKVQVAAQMFCAELEWGTAAAWVGGSNYLFEDQAFDPQFFHDWLPYLKDFRRRVEQRDPYPPQDVDEQLSELKRIYSDVRQYEAVELPEEAADWLRQYQRASSAVSRLNKLKKELKANVLAHMRDARYGVVKGAEKAFGRIAMPATVRKMKANVQLRLVNPPKETVDG